LAAIDQTTHVSVQAILSATRSLYIRPSNQEAKDSAFRSAVPHLQEILKTRDVAFQRLIPEINKERSQAIQLVNLSQPDLAADNAAFNNAIAKSNENVEIPGSWQSSLFLYSLKYDAIEIYLTTLAQRLHSSS
jgi:hypothetical protein